MIVRKSELYLSLAFYLVATALAQTSGSSSSRDTSGSDSGQLPTGLEYDDDADPQEVAAGVSYLRNYGYILTRSSHQSPQYYRYAVSRMQEYANIPVTGILDNNTLTMMKRPRCGLPDIIDTNTMRRRKKRYQLAGSKWGKKDLTYRIVNYTPDLPQWQVQDAFSRALKAWSDHTPLTFRATSSSTADIQIKFARGSHGDGYPFDGRGGTLAHAYFPGPGIGGDAHFDDGERYTHRSVTGTNLFLVAAHELGHSLGLGHSDVSNALMAPFYSGYTTGSVVQPDDIRGIQRLYGRRPPNKPETPNGNPNPRPGPRPQPPRGNPRPQPPRGDPRPQPPRGDPRPGPNPPKPRPECNYQFDAAYYVAPHLYLFQGQTVWRINQNRQVDRGWPKKVTEVFPRLQGRVSAVYRKPDSTIVVFSGTQYYEYQGQRLKPGFPKSVQSLRMGISRVDAAVVWARNGKTYFFSGDEYWRYDERRKRPDNGYPRPIEGNWRGIPSSPSAAFANGQGKTYFIKGKQYYRFDDQNVRADAGFPRLFSVEWLRCDTSRVFGRATGEGHNSAVNSGRLSNAFLNIVTSLFVLLYLLHIHH